MMPQVWPHIFWFSVSNCPFQSNTLGFTALYGRHWSTLAEKCTDCVRERELPNLHCKALQQHPKKRNDLGFVSLPACFFFFFFFSLSLVLQSSLNSSHWDTLQKQAKETTVSWVAEFQLTILLKMSSMSWLCQRARQPWTDTEGHFT